MYERFTDRARKVMRFANEEAQRFNHEYIGTEHILLGLVQEDAGVAVNVLKNLNIDLRKIRRMIEQIITSGPDLVTTSQLPQTPRAKKVIEYSIEEARNFNYNYVGTEHLLLGLLREQEGVAAQVLTNLGLKLEDVREEILNSLGHTSAYDFPESRFSDEDGTGAAQPARLDLPEAIRQRVAELEAQIEHLTLEKEAAIAEQDFEKAARLRDQADKLNKEMTRIIREALDELD
jgi:ATP-dependent Clp protease ATP-binding subunit ClpC